MTINVYVGDVSDCVGLQAKKADASASLLTPANYKNICNGTFYTSIGDLDNLNQFAYILRAADNIFYVEPETWSNRKLKEWTENYLVSFSFLPNKHVHGFAVNASLADVNNFLQLSAARKQKHNSQLWVSGCSISAGVGVLPEQRYGSLLAEKLNLEVSFLTSPGSSMRWQADQILRSDLQQNDILIWGLTGINRKVQLIQQQIRHINVQSTNVPTDELRYLTSDYVLYDAVNSIYQVINFCNKIKCKYILASPLPNGIESLLSKCNYFINLNGHFGRTANNIFMDTGTDNQHPGPLMHNYYADIIFEKYNTLYKESTI